MKENAPVQPILNAARIEEATVEYVDTDKEGRTFIYARCDSRKIHPENLELHSLTRCYPVNLMGGATGRMAINPPEGTKCLIMFKNPGTTPKDFLIGYYLGALEEKSEMTPINEDMKASPGSFIHKTEKGSGINISGSTSKASLFSAKSHVTVENENVTIGNGISALTLGANGFQIESFDSKQQPIGVLSMSSKSVFIKSEGGIVLGAQAGEINLIGDGATIQTTSLVSIKSRSTEIIATGSLATTSANRVETVGGDPIKFALPLPSYQIRVASGGYSLGVAIGDIDIVASNPFTYNSITIKNGSSIGPFASTLELGAFDITLKQRSTALVSKLQLGLGMAALTSKLIMNIESGSIFIKSDVMISIKTSMFVLMGGTVVPNPAMAYFNALPVCAFTGMPHGGNSIVG